MVSLCLFLVVLFLGVRLMLRCLAMVVDIGVILSSFILILFVVSFFIIGYKIYNK